MPHTGVISVSKGNKNEPKEFNIPSLPYSITAESAAHMLVREQEKVQEIKEIRDNKVLHAAASKIIKNQIIAERKAGLKAAEAAAKGAKASGKS